MVPARQSLIHKSQKINKNDQSITEVQVDEEFSDGER